MPRVAVLPDAGNLREGIQSPIYVEEVSPEDLEDEYISLQFLERLEFAVRGQLGGEVERVQHYMDVGD